ncbi:MAG: hypothetical protein ACRCZK_03005 [Oscillospiraceae bacterium]
MLYIINDIKKNSSLRNFYLKRKNKIDIENVVIKNIEYKNINLRMTNKKYLYNFLCNLNDDDFVYIDKDISNEKLRHHQNVNTTFDDVSFTYDCIYDLISKNNINKTFVLALNINNFNVLDKFIHKIKVIKIISNNLNESENITDNILENYGASVMFCDNNDIINNSIIINIDNIDINIGNNNIVFSNINEEIKGNTIISDMMPVLKSIYLRNKPSFIEDIEFYFLLKKCYNLNDEINKNMYKCNINNKKHFVRDILNFIDR